MSSNISSPQVPAAEEHQAGCKHDQGFEMVTLHFNPTYPAVWWCKKSCSYWLPFDPDAAGALRLSVKKGNLTLEDINSAEYWGNQLIAYTPEPKGDKVLTFSRSKING